MNDRDFTDALYLSKLKKNAGLNTTQRWEKWST